MKRVLVLVAILWLCPGAEILARAEVAHASNYERFMEARSLAFEGRRDEARALCLEILAADPAASETKTLLGRINAWEGNYDRARQLLGEVVDANPRNADARRALIDVEVWSGRPEVARELAQQGLELRPGNSNLLVASAKALSKLGLAEEALAAAREAVAADPEDFAKLKFYRLLLEDTQKNKLSADYRREWFNDATEPWAMTTLSYRREFGWGSIIPRLNVAERFGKSDVQFEVDSYPEVGDQMYAYLNFGVSGDDLFPSIRYGAELYRNFRKGWEASFGFRRLDFDSADVTIVTGSVARYIGKYWIELRPQYVTKDSGNSFSGRVRIRRFFNGRYEYMELSGGAGDDLGSDLVDTASDLDSSSVQVSYNRRVRDSLILKSTLGIERENLPNGRNRDGIFFRLGLDYLF